MANLWYCINFLNVNNDVTSDHRYTSGPLKGMHDAVGLPLDNTILSNYNKFSNNIYLYLFSIYDYS